MRIFSYKQQDAGKKIPTHHKTRTPDEYLPQLIYVYKYTKYACDIEYLSIKPICQNTDPN